LNKEDADQPPSPSWREKILQFIKGNPSNREELVDVFRTATDDSIINDESLAMLEGALQMSDMQARDIMVPRSQMVVIDNDLSLVEMYDRVTESAHSRFPVIGEDRDDVQGILLAKDMLKLLRPGTEITENTDRLLANLRPAVVVPESKRLDVLLKEFRINRNHMAIVVDEYGGVSGLVTIEDILEEIVGEIEDETDIHDEQVMILTIDESTWLVQAHLDIDDFNDHFKTSFIDDEFDTVGGLLLQSFGHLPANGEQTQIGDYLFEIVEADNRRIISVRVTFQPAVQEEQASEAS
jgi:magnesium and cobalt transporter